MAGYKANKNGSLPLVARDISGHNLNFYLFNHTALYNVTRMCVFFFLFSERYENRTVQSVPRWRYSSRDSKYYLGGEWRKERDENSSEQRRRVIRRRGEFCPDTPSFVIASRETTNIPPETPSHWKLEPFSP